MSTVTNWELKFKKYILLSLTMDVVNNSTIC